MRRRTLKVGILTFHRCVNYGAYWQVRCLSRGIADQGHEVHVLNYMAPNYAWRELKHALRRMRPAPKSDVFHLALKTLKFIRAQQTLPLTRLFSLDRPPHFADYDLVVVGSDEVWNLAHPWLGGKPIFFGSGLRPRRLVSYAASFGNYDASRGLPAPWPERLKAFDRISVRDPNSTELIRSSLGIDPVVVLDPCLQFRPEPRSAARGLPASPYLLVYGNRFNDGLIQELKAHAKGSGLRIVSVGYRNHWTDETRLRADPDEFVHLYRGATAVATTYFHGCVFSVQFGRPFVAQLSDYRSIKVQGLLTQLNATHRIYDPQQSGRMSQLLSTSLEDCIGQALTERRKTSTAYIDSCLAD